MLSTVCLVSYSCEFTRFRDSKPFHKNGDLTRYVAGLQLCNGFSGD